MKFPMHQVECFREEIERAIAKLQKCIAMPNLTTEGICSSIEWPRIKINIEETEFLDKNIAYFFDDVLQGHLTVRRLLLLKFYMKYNNMDNGEFEPGMGISYPIGGCGEYHNEWSNNTLWENPRRIECAKMIIDDLSHLIATGELRVDEFVINKQQPQKRTNLPTLPGVRVEICKMSESSGNHQFFVRAKRTDTQDSGVFNLAGTLEYQCFQTKDGNTIEQAIKNAMFAASFLARFFGTSREDLTLVGFNEDEIAMAKSARKWR